MRKPLTILMLAVLAVGIAFSGGCMAGYTITKREAIDKAIATARADTEAKLTALKEQEVKALRDTIATHAAREQTASDYLFKGSVTYSTLKPETIGRPTLIMGQSIQQTSAQLPPATAAAQAATFKALQVELDEAKVSTQVLIAQYEKELGQAKAVGEARGKELAALDVKVKEVEKEKEKVLSGALKTEQDLQAAKDKVQDKDLAEAEREREAAQHNEKVKMWLIGILLAAAALCGLGAAFVPVPSLKKQLIVGAAICGGAALAIPFVTPWMVWVAVGVGLLPVVAWTVKTYKDEHNDATDTYRGLQEFKNTSPETFKEEVAPLLQEWHTDPNTVKRIDERLKQVGDV
jgi:hypothetical protein